MDVSRTEGTHGMEVGLLALVLRMGASFSDFLGLKVGFVYSRIAYTPCSSGNDVRITIVELRMVASCLQCIQAVVGGAGGGRLQVAQEEHRGRRGACRSMGTAGAMGTKGKGCPG